MSGNKMRFRLSWGHRSPGSRRIQESSRDTSSNKNTSAADVTFSTSCNKRGAHEHAVRLGRIFGLWTHSICKRQASRSLQHLHGGCLRLKGVRIRIERISRFSDAWSECGRRRSSRADVECVEPVNRRTAPWRTAAPSLPRRSTRSLQDPTLKKQRRSSSM